MLFGEFISAVFAGAPGRTGNECIYIHFLFLKTDPLISDCIFLAPVVEWSVNVWQ
jgi:hypothetical protein